jgi:predicted GTPase
VVALVLDGMSLFDRTFELTRLEVQQAAEAVREGRGLVIVVNKMDGVPRHDREKVCRVTICSNSQSLLLSTLVKNTLVKRDRICAEKLWIGLADVSCGSQEFE